MSMGSTLDDSDLAFGLVLLWLLWLSGRNMRVVLTGLAHALYIRPDLFQLVVTVNFINDTNILDPITH